MKKNNLFCIVLLAAAMVFANMAFISCSKDDDDKDSKKSSLEGYWKLTKSVDDNSHEQLFGNNEGFIWQFDETNLKIDNYEYDYEGQILIVGSINYETDGHSVSYIITDPKSGETMKISNEIKKLNSKELVLYSNYSKETTYFKRVSPPETEQVSINKNQLNGEWQLVETWKPGDSKPEVVDPSEVRTTWKFTNSGDLLQETTYMHGPAMANMFKWNLNGNNIYLFNYIDPNKFEKSYDIVRYGGTYPILKIREWTSEYSYKIMKFKSMAVG